MVVGVLGQWQQYMYRFVCSAVAVAGECWFYDCVISFGCIRECLKLGNRIGAEFMCWDQLLA